MGTKVRTLTWVIGVAAFLAIGAACGPNGNPSDASRDALPDAGPKLDAHPDRPVQKDARPEDRQADTHPVDAKRDMPPTEARPVDAKRDTPPMDTAPDGPGNPCAEAADGTSCSGAGVTGGHCCAKACVPNDVSHCGATCQVCASHANAAARCDSTTGCGFTCLPNYADCDPQMDGCETSLLSDKNHCGACGTACTDTASSTFTCNNGQCALSKCQQGTGDCDGNTTNGCETQLNTPGHCGACTAVCPAYSNATAGCSNGNCTSACNNPQYQDCDSATHNGSDSNGCETNVLGTDLNHCGSCSACPTMTNKVASCASGVCHYACAPGRADCNGPGDGSDSDGCETNLSLVGNCGACGHACGAQNDSPSCVASGSTYVCSLACTAGFLNCDGNAANGCETDGTTIGHCGSCTTTCTGTTGGNTTPVCSKSGSVYGCGVHCQSGFADCDGNTANGCETNLMTDDLNCGRCNVDKAVIASDVSSPDAWCAAQLMDNGGACKVWDGDHCVGGTCLNCAQTDAADLGTCCGDNPDAYCCAVFNSLSQRVLCGTSCSDVSCAPSGPVVCD